MADQEHRRFVTRGGDKLAFALDHFRIDPAGRVCADLGSHIGGFVDCLVQCGAGRVYSVDTAYGQLAWTLRKNERVVPVERTNAMHVRLPEPVDLLTIDVGWTPQAKILPQASSLITPTADVISLIKPHYESRADELDQGVLRDDALAGVLARTLATIESLEWRIVSTVESPIRGHAGNRELLAWLRRD